MAFSGGKDSCVVLDLVKRAGVKYDAHYNLTTVDPPELVYFIRDNYPDVIVDRPKKSMWQMIVDNGIMPTSFARYCCKELKERGGVGRVKVTGVRHAESPRRAGRKMEETCTAHANTKYIHPIIEWSDEEVWEYIHKYNVPYCRLYDEGQKRIGCIMCPMKTVRLVKDDMQRWPKYAALYRRYAVMAFNKRAEKVERGEAKPQLHSSGEEMYEWWVNQDYRKKKDDDRQISIFGLMADESIL